MTVLDSEQNGALAPGARIEELLVDGAPPEEPGAVIDVFWVDPLGLPWSRRNGVLHDEDD